MFFTERPQGDRAKMKYMSTGVASGKTKGNILSTMNAKLNIYTMESVAKLTAESSFKLEDIGFGDKPIAVFLGIPYGDKSKHQLATTFIRQHFLSMQTFVGMGESVNVQLKIYQMKLEICQKLMIWSTWLRYRQDVILPMTYIFSLTHSLMMFMVREHQKQSVPTAEILYI